MVRKRQVGVSENRGPSYSTLNSRILIIREPKIRYPPPPYFRKLPGFRAGQGYGAGTPLGSEIAVLPPSEGPRVMSQSLMFRCGVFTGFRGLGVSEIRM